MLCKVKMGGTDPACAAQTCPLFLLLRLEALSGCNTPMWLGSAFTVEQTFTATGLGIRMDVPNTLTKLSFRKTFMMGSE